MARLTDFHRQHKATLATSTRVGVLVIREKGFWALSAQGSLTALGATAPGRPTASFSIWPEAGGLTALTR
jgi:hypothetical protein